MNYKLSTIITFISLFCLAGHAFAAAPGFYRFEVEGTGNVYVFANNARVVFSEAVTWRPMAPLQLSVCGEQHFRNYSLDEAWLLSAGYRYQKGALAVPPAVVSGVRNLYIGAYSTAIPALGVESGLYYSLTPQVSVRARYRYLLFFDEVKVSGHNLLFGLGYSFGWQ